MGLLYRAMGQGCGLAAGGPLWPGRWCGTSGASSRQGAVGVARVALGILGRRVALCESAFAALMLVNVPGTSEKPLKEFG